MVFMLSLLSQRDGFARRDANRLAVVDLEPAVPGAGVVDEGIVRGELQPGKVVHAVHEFDVGAVPDVLLATHHFAEALDQVPVAPVVELIAVAPDIHQIQVLLFEELQEKAVAIGVGSVSEEVIDEINILQATLLAMRKALDALSPPADLALVDALTLPELQIPQISIIKGDAKSISIAAASVIAKVTRDRVMKEMDALYPEYGFAKHKGYGTAAHIAALKQYGPCRIHRRSFIGHFV